ncbi:MAG: IS1634 family transposase, partial [Dermatophilaceae bacterium]
MAYIRTVRTGSGATAVQLVAKRRGRRWVLEHVGSAHDEVELAVLVAAAQGRLEQLQPALDLGIEVPARAAQMVPSPVTDRLGVELPGRQSTEPVAAPRVVGASSDLLLEVLAGM